MLTVLIKEFRSFFSGATGILTLGVFQLAAGLFLWVIPGEYNVLDAGYSSLNGFFQLAPWLFLFLVPGITMRMFSEEKRMGTLELLFTHPISKFHIIVGKYLAAVLLGIAALLPTTVYFISIYYMGETRGNIDIGATAGSYLGLLLIFAAFTAIGLCCSSWSKNALVSFIVSASLCFLSYYGWDLMSSLFSDGAIQHELFKFSIYSHYQSMSRGVIDLQDVIFFFLVGLLFLTATGLALLKNCPINKKLLIKQGGLIVVVLVGLVFLGGYKLVRIDMTLEKRFTLAEQTKGLLKQLDKPINIDVYLDGDLNAGFTTLKEAVKDLVTECSYYNNNIIIHFYDPNALTSSTDGRSLAEVLESKGVSGVQVNERKKDGTHVQKVVYPWLSISYNGANRKVNILNNNPAKNGYENLNSSAQDLEYKITDALRTLSNTKEEAIAFLEGHKEYAALEVEDISRSLSEYYRIDRGTIQDDPSMLDAYKLIIVAGSVKAFTEKEKYILDQYIMKGGKVLWMLDGTNMSMDSLNTAPTTYSFPNDLNLNDQLFQYGARINANLIEDVQCIKIPINTAKEGDTPNYIPMPWYFAPLLFPNTNQVIGKMWVQLRVYL